MSATDRIREAVNGQRRVLAPDDLLALCDLADAARALRHALDKGDYRAAAHRVDRALDRLDGEGGS